MNKKILNNYSNDINVLRALYENIETQHRVFEAIAKEHNKGYLIEYSVQQNSNFLLHIQKVLEVMDVFSHYVKELEASLQDDEMKDNKELKPLYKKLQHYKRIYDLWAFFSRGEREVVFAVGGFSINIEKHKVDLKDNFAQKWIFKLSLPLIDPKQHKEATFNGNKIKYCLMSDFENQFFRMLDAYKAKVGEIKLTDDEINQNCAQYCALSASFPVLCTYSMLVEANQLLHSAKVLLRDKNFAKYHSNVIKDVKHVRNWIDVDSVSCRQTVDSDDNFEIIDIPWSMENREIILLELVNTLSKYQSFCKAKFIETYTSLFPRGTI